MLQNVVQIVNTTGRGCLLNLFIESESDVTRMTVFKSFLFISFFFQPYSYNKTFLSYQGFYHCPKSEVFKNKEYKI